MKSINPKKRYWIAAGLAGVSLMVGMVFFLYHKATTPLGPALMLPIVTLPAQPVAIPREIATPGNAGDLGGDDTAGSSTPAPSDPAIAKEPPSHKVKPVCGGPESMLILGIGADSSNYRYGLADVIRIVRLDFVQLRITAVSLPRDLWIELPDIGQPAAFTHGKINQAYLFGMPGMNYYDGADGGPGTLALAIQHNYGLSVDHYAAVNMHVFESMVDALGGVVVELDYNIYAGGYGGEVLYAAGRHHFDGATSLHFARTRRGYSDFQRQDNQSLLIYSLAKRVLQPSVFPKIPALVKAFDDQVLSDLTPEQISKAICLLVKVDQEDIVLSQLPDGMLKTGRTYSPIFRANTSIVSGDRQEISETLARFAAGEWP
jgi:LCP family protein required for cell wall assembly